MAEGHRVSCWAASICAATPGKDADLMGLCCTAWLQTNVRAAPPERFATLALLFGRGPAGPGFMKVSLFKIMQAA